MAWRCLTAVGPGSANRGVTRDYPRVEPIDAPGHRPVVRNGCLPERQVLPAIRPVTVRPPRIEDRHPEDSRETFDGKILPPYLRRTESLDEAIPWMYRIGGEQHQRYGRIAGSAAGAGGTGRIVK